MIVMPTPIWSIRHIPVCRFTKLTILPYSNGSIGNEKRVQSHIMFWLFRIKRIFTLLNSRAHCKCATFHLNHFYRSAIRAIFYIVDFTA